MRPLKLKMEAFGSYGRETVIDFTRPSQDLFLITGDTGSGKSTIFEAIVFALYGAPDRDKKLKNGLDYGSQFVREDAVPYVELTFTELTGGEELTYIVRRSPRHRVRKKRGEGYKDVPETLSLFMPDGSEYPQKETQEKLIEITGLTREQFMQVAMIAQGEFMELIRSDTAKRKPIFRKLFGTEIYERIVAELDSRRKLLEADMEKIRSVCASEAGRIVLPGDADGESPLAQARDRVISSKKISVTDLELLTDELEKLCNSLTDEADEAKKTVALAEKERDIVRAECTRAETLIKTFETAEKAEAELRECRNNAERIKEAEKLRRAIQDSFAVKAKYDVYAVAGKDAEQTAAQLEKLRRDLPGLTADAEASENAGKKAAAGYDKELEACTKVRERVNKALTALKELSEAVKALEERKKGFELSAQEAASAEKAMKDHERQEKEWKERETALSGADAHLVEVRHKREDILSARSLYNSAADAEKAVKEQEKTAERARAAYIKAKDQYDIKNEEYILMRSRFLDAQAGLLARELRPGKKCPVCGSEDHPEPCVLKEEHRELTRETVEALDAGVKKLDDAQNRCSSEAKTASELLEEKKKQAAERLTTLLSATAALSGRDTEGMTAEEAGRELDELLAAAEERCTDAKKKADLLEKVREDLRNAGAVGEKLRESAKKAADNVNAAKNGCSAAEAAVKERESRIDYPTAEEAQNALSAAENKLREKEEQKISAQSKASLAKKKADQTAAQISQYQGQLPALEERLDALRAEYDKEMQEKDVAEYEWKDITAKHSPEETESLTERIDAYNRKKLSAESTLKAANDSLGDQKKPDIAALEEKKEKAGEVYTAAAQRYDSLRELLHTDSGVLASMRAKMDERRITAENWSRTDSLHRRLAGKMTDGRMDVETRVQRFYLERILDAANRRFSEMSDGRFELRMTSEEDAAKGSNTGLDLMVYSNVNGREREIKTLSGGESFMAALALALGMADQIQESSAAVNLDIMFIDEGFGSLSDHARAQAIKVLRSMAGGSRLIGIISHVTELKQQIDDKLVVDKDDTGSSVHWVIS